MKCTYCNFAIDPGLPPGARQERYVRAVRAEMSRRATGVARGADTLYFGGGTPSLLAARGLAPILDAARSRYALAPGAEVTLEANPRDLDAAGYAGLRRIGVNRLSLGVQHFDDGVLAAMGRVHRSSDSVEAVARAREAAFENVSIDLILGWPGETTARWSETLDRALGLRPQHVSLYLLEIEGRNVLAHQARIGTLALPDDDLVADLYASAVESLESAGLRRYEISSFSLPGRESRHNRRYWDDADFLGFGLSAHSYVGGRRSWNEATFGRYCAAVEAGGTGEAGGRTLGAHERVSEALFTGLRRRDGVVLDEFRRRYGVDVSERFGARLHDARAGGLLEEAGGALRLTDRGVLLSNEVFRALV